MDNYKAFKDEGNKEITEIGKSIEVKEATNKWINIVNNYKYSYHFEHMGRPIIQYPQDMVAIQELIWNIKPDLIIETGIAHGGSLILSASMLALIDYCEAVEQNKSLDPKDSKRKVLGIDIDIRKHNKEAVLNHPMSHLIKMIQGSSIEKDTIKQVRDFAKDYKKILIFLDSNHTHEHALAELEGYSDLVSVGSYCVVFDTIIEDLKDSDFSDRPWDIGNNPKTAVWQFLKTHDEFVIDKEIQDKLQITVAPDGYLKRTK